MADVERPGAERWLPEPGQGEPGIHKLTDAAAQCRGCEPWEETVGDARVRVTAHPSSVLRLRGRDGWEEALDQLVADLEVVAALVKG